MQTTLRLFVLGTIALAATLLAVGCTTHQIKRSALVPAVTPPIMTGHPIDNGRVRVSVGNATYLRAAKPRETPGKDTNSGLHIPRTNVAGQLLVRIGRHVGLGGKMELGVGPGANPIADDVAPRPAGNTFGMGPVAQAWFPVWRGLEIHIHGELLLFGAPYDEYIRRSTSGSEPPEPWKLLRSGTDYVWVFTVAGALSYRVGPFAFFAGFAARNQPTNVEVQDVAGSAGVALAWTQDEVTSGPVYSVLFGGASLRFAKRFEATAQLYQPLSNEPVQYGGPAMAIFLSVAFGDAPLPLRSASRPPTRRPLRPRMVPGARPHASPPAPPRKVAPPPRRHVPTPEAPSKQPAGPSDERPS